MDFINNVSSNYLQSVLSTLQSSGSTTGSAANSPNGIVAPQSDTQQLSPFAKLLNTLQQLQQSDPAKYQQVTQQIATSLETAAQNAQGDGNSTAANQLNQLAADFSNASTSGQLPNIQDLARATAGRQHHHHHHAHSAPSDADSNSNDPSIGSDPSGPLSQLLSGLHANGTPNDALNPTAILLNTLSSAGIPAANG